jgi:2-C-methyl-D-erythritol 4-phosphate cytidylyltransferase
MLRGQAVIVHGLRAFLARGDVGLIVIPTHLQNEITAVAPSDVKDAMAAGRIVFCAGGASRAESVLEGLGRVPESIEWVAVHDAARPLVSQELIDRTVAMARERGAAVPALPVTLTVKEAEGPLPARVIKTVPRERLWAMQTPQVMRRIDLERAYSACPVELGSVTDDIQLLELAGMETWLVQGEERNVKITTGADLRIAELMYGHG